MNVIPMLLVLGLLLAGGFLACFVWAVKTGQFDDTYTPSLRILSDGESDTTPDLMTPDLMIRDGVTNLPKEERNR